MRRRRIERHEQAINGAFADRDYELISYAIRNDYLSGTSRSAPEGEPMIVVGGPALGAHLNIQKHEAVMTDIARRLRGLPTVFSETE